MDNYSNDFAQLIVTARLKGWSVDNRPTVFRLMNYSHDNLLWRSKIDDANTPIDGCMIEAWEHSATKNIEYRFYMVLSGKTERSYMVEPKWIDIFLKV